jgi:hypothetical protein
LGSRGSRAVKDYLIIATLPNHWVEKDAIGPRLSPKALTV